MDGDTSVIRPDPPDGLGRRRWHAPLAVAFGLVATTLAFAFARAHRHLHEHTREQSTAFWDWFNDVAPWLVLLMGAAATAGVAALVEVTRRAQNRAYRLVTEVERKHAELDRSERRYRELVERIPLVTYIYETDPDGVILYTSPQVAQLTGVTAEEYLGDADLWLTMVHADDLERVVDELDRHIATGEPLVSEYRLIARDGTVRWIDDRSVIDEAEGTRVSTGYWQDITERKELESQLQQSQRMEAVGRLAGGIAHDFNNMLSVITVSSQVLLTEMASDDAGRTEVEEIAHAAERGAGLTRQLVAFSRRQVLRPERLDVNEAVMSMERMLSRLLGAGVQVISSLHPEPCLVEVDPGQLEQVIVNLAVNARDAMPAGGVLSLVTALGTLEDGSQAVVLVVRDTGHGMDDAVLGRLFEPFFTTKEKGKGTGLGLSTVYGIVQQSRGTISVESEPGVGTTFEMALPRVGGTPPKPGSVTGRAADGESDEAPLRVLLVEDNDDVRRAIRRVLEQRAHEVREAANGEEALEILRAEGPVDIVVTDVAMPKMGGIELVETLRATQPELPVIYMSGFPDPGVDVTVEGDPHTVFVAKPFGPVELIAAIDGVGRGAQQA